MLRLLIIFAVACGAGETTIISSDIASLAGTRIVSNVRASDYVGPETCGLCHDEQHAQWSGNLHRSMNRKAGDKAAIVGDFSGVSVDYAGGSATFTRDGETPVMILRDRDGAKATYVVTRTIGARYIQEYVGVRQGGEATELRLPFGYWLRERRWFHQQYFDSWFGNEYDSADQPTINPYEVDPTPWATRCAWCHNTYPFDIRAGRSQSDQPRGHGPEAMLTLAKTPQVSGNLLPLDSLVTVGISCESCHFGGRDHAENPRKRIEFRPVSADLTWRADELAGTRGDARTINAVCLQCHSAPAPLWPSGASKRNSREAIDLVGGACASAIKCTDCHDPHRREPGAGIRPAASFAPVCIGCHDKLGNAEAAAKHSGHQASDASCLDCHMPPIVQGFSSQLRTHRISSPSAETVMAGNEPDACGLCHLEMSSRELALELVRGFGQRPSPGGGEPTALDQPIGRRWLDSNDPTLRVTAAASYARSHVGDMGVAAELAKRLDDPIAYYRMRMFFALRDVFGPKLKLDFEPTSVPAVRRDQQRRLIQAIDGARSKVGDGQFAP